MLNPDQFRSHVIRPTLATIGLQSRAAECLLLGTALVESGLTALVQKGREPALGVYQVEPGTHADIWKNFLAFRPALALKVAKLRALPNPDHGQLVWNLGYATAVARLVNNDTERRALSALCGGEWERPITADDVRRIQELGSLLSGS